MTERDVAPKVTDTITLADALERDLLARYGPIIGADDLRQALGYASMDAFRQALSRRQLPVPVFALPNRRGKFSLSKDVAQWLATSRAGGTFPADSGSSGSEPAGGST